MISKKLQRYLTKKEKQRKQRFLSYFDCQTLVTVVKYYKLTCADHRQKRCLCKSIRDSEINYQQIWRAIRESI